MARRSPGRLGPQGRTRVIAGLSVLIAAAVVVVLVLRSSPSSASGSDRATGTSGGAATVQRRNLVATDTESGTLSYAGPQTVYNRLGGTITWLPPVGRTIRPGGVLYRVDGQPVILLGGSTPAYRTLDAADVDGHDILELNRNLKRLGFNSAGITADDLWQAGTSLGVEELQESLGEEPTGSLTLGQVVFLPGPQLVSALDTTVGSTGSGGGASGASAQDSSTAPAAAAPEFVSLTATVSTTTSTTATPPSRSGSTTTQAPTTTPTTTTTPHSSSHGSSGAASKALSALAKQLKAETAQLKAATAALKAAGKNSSHSSSHHSSSSSHHSGSSSNNSGGSSGGSATAILQTTSTRLVVTVDLDASSQSEAKVGERVTVEMPAGNTVSGRITAVSRVAQSSSSGSSGEGDQGSGPGSSGASSTVPVTITLARRNAGAGLDQAAVSVNFVSQRARNVLSVPVTALVATSGARYALQAASPPHALIPVTVGLFAAGYVQVSGRGVHAGLAVTDSQG